MTKEEAIHELSVLWDRHKHYEGKEAIRYFMDGNYTEALEMAIETLEAEPCEDAISRQAVEEMIEAEMPERGMWEIEGDKEKETVCEVCVDLMQKLFELSPVTPAEKVGRWVDRFPLKECKCSACDYLICISSGSYLDMAKNMNFCPNCGAKMQEVEE